MLVEPGFFRTELLTTTSTTYAEPVALEQPPTRFAAGADAVQTFEAKAATLLGQARAHRALSTSVAHED